MYSGRLHLTYKKTFVLSPSFVGPALSALPDNKRTLNLTKETGFKLDHLSDGTVKGVLNPKEEVIKDRRPEPPAEAEKVEKHSESEAEVTPL